jgi:hypothetical protein
MKDLYGLDLTGAKFRRRCGGNVGGDEDGESESCVETAAVPGHPGVFALRDSKNPGAGTLMFTAAELHAAGMTIE